MAFTRKRPNTNNKPLTGAMSPQQASFIEAICNKLGIPNPTLNNNAMTKQEASDFISKVIETFNIVRYLTSKSANKCKGPNGIERAGYQVYIDIFCPYFIFATNCPVDLADKLFDPDEIGFDFEVMLNCITDAVNVTLEKMGFEPHLEVEKTNVASGKPPYCRVSTTKQTTGYANSIISKVASAKASAQPVAQAQPVQATPTVSAPPVVQPAVQPAQAQPVQKISVATDDEWNKLFKVMTTLMGKPANATKDTVLKFINHLCEVLSCGSDNERALAFTRFKRTLQGYVQERCVMDNAVGSTDIDYVSKYTWELFQGRDSKKLDAQSKSTALRLVNKVDVTYFRKDIILKSNYFIHTDARNKFYESDLAHYVMSVMGPIIKSKYNNDIFAFYKDIFSDVKSKAKLWGIPKGILCLIYLYKALNSVKSAPNVTNIAIPKVAQRNRGTVSRDGLRNTFFTY